MKVLSPIIRSLITEKSSLRQSTGKYTFLVHKNATKISVKKAIKEIYGVDAGKVTMMISPQKTRQIKQGRLWAKRPIMKKAIVNLKGKKTIDPNKIKEHKK